MALVFDIETAGEDFDSLDMETQDALTRWIKKESRDDGEYAVALDDLKQGLGFSPLTGEIVAIGVYDTEKDKSVVYFQDGGTHMEETKEGDVTYKPASEKEMLEHFWEGAQRYEEFVTFNGRTFDVPFIIVRSAVHGIKPTKDLMHNRYLSLQPVDAKHIDLLDQLNFYGAMRRKGSLHLWTRAFGITSPKIKGVTGDDVTALFRDGEYLAIAQYNARDIRATKELYDKWHEFFPS